ncbi:MAG: pseudouridine synthase [Gammaproteobacteria bacterium]|nr:pseudouridine synthase [Gammaproteobacteria bacterium]
MANLIAFHKPYGVLSQFTDGAGRATLRDFIAQRGVYPAGRLDQDSEGLLLLTDDGALQARISHPRHKLPKTYVLQVVGQPDDQTCQRLIEGVELADGAAQAIAASPTPRPAFIKPRVPPLPAHREVQCTWFSITLTSGRNRQVRRMLAAVGYPVLRLIRTQIGPWRLDDLTVGESRSLTVHLPSATAQSRHRSRRS